MANAKQDFKSAASEALADRSLQKALGNVKRGFIVKREAAKAKLPEFDTLREEARAIKDHTLSHLDLYLEAYERKVTRAAGRCITRRERPMRAPSCSSSARRPAPSSSPRASRW